MFIYINSRDRWHQSARGPVNSSTVILAGYVILTVQIHVLPKVSCRWQAHHSRRRSADLIWERLRQRTPRGTTAWHLKPVGTAVWNWICFVYYVSFPYLKLLLLLLFSNNWRMAQPILLILVVVIVVFLLWILLLLLSNYKVHTKYKAKKKKTKQKKKPIFFIT